MPRTLLKVVTLAEVLRVVPPDIATQAATAHEAGQAWGLWEFDHEGIARIGGQSVYPPNPTRSVRELNNERKAWMETVDGSQALDKHTRLLADFAKGDFLSPPVLIFYRPHNWVAQIRDGAHRIFAAYEHTTQHKERRLRVYWNRLDLES